MPTVKEIYSDLFEGKKLSIRVADRKQFDRLRVALHKEHRTIVAVDLSELSLCADFVEASGAGTFWLGQSRRMAANNFEIVGVEDAETTNQWQEAEIPEAMGNNSFNGSASACEISEGIPQNPDSSSQEGKSEG